MTNLAAIEEILYNILLHRNRLGVERQEEIYLAIRDAINARFGRRLRLCQYRAIRYRTMRQHTQLLRELRGLPRRHGPAQAAAFFAHLGDVLPRWVQEAYPGSK